MRDGYDAAANPTAISAMLTRRSLVEKRGVILLTSPTAGARGRGVGLCGIPVQHSLSLVAEVFQGNELLVRGAGNPLAVFRWQGIEIIVHDIAFVRKGSERLNRKSF